MGLYQTKRYTKGRDGQWNCRSCKVENIPHNVSYWKKSGVLESKSKLGEHTYLQLKNSRTGKTKQVANATTYFGRKEKVSRVLITSSNKLPKRYKG